MTRQAVWTDLRRWDPVNRAAVRARREIVARVGPLRAAGAHRRQAELDAHRDELPDLPPAARRLLGQLGADSVVRTRLDELDAMVGIDSSDVRRELEQVAEVLAAVAPDRPVVRAGADVQADHPAVWGWGLREELLDLVENHVGVPVRYYGADVRREHADGSRRDVRQWHRDTEDHRVVKIIVWLNDVGEAGGPFEHLTPQDTAHASAALRYVTGFVDDERMAEVVPTSAWRSCTGPRWTAVLTDTSRVFHRARPPMAQDRYSATFTWTTRHPIRTLACERFDRTQTRRLTAGLNARQLACLPLHLSQP